ncbi:MAG: helix-turn-helix domain-containing protein [Clostridia bacterium]|nr:helix-turn-helix domain-containing protein [Clostridia bacterium]
MSFGYHAFPDRSASGLNKCSRQSDEFPLIVNCAGNASFTFPFTTDNPTGREDYYLLYMLQGEMIVFLPHGSEQIRAGHAVIFPPRYHYIYKYDAKAPMNYLWVHFTGSYVDRFLQECGFGSLPSLYDTGTDPQIAPLFRELYDCFEFDSPLSRPKSASALERILLRLAEHIQKKSESKPLERSLRVIHASYQTDLKIPELAALENLSHSRYITVFREQMGMSPTAYIIRRRMSAACELLENTDIPVKQVGGLVGYNDPHFFSKLFKKHVGCSPSDYRANAAGKGAAQ